MHAPSDTVAAISTAWGEAGIAVVRVSGSCAVPLARSILRFGPKGFPPPRTMRLAALLDGADNAIDQVLAVHFPGPHSFTGEDVVEVHTHGGTLVPQLCLEGLLRRGARMAEPGEFTRRAFLNGRMDLSQAESVLGIIRSRSEEALRAAARTLSGEFSEFVRQIRDELLTLQGDLEVGLDFPEDAAPAVDPIGLHDALETLRITLRDLEDRCSLGLLLREGIRVVISGRPNVGKSSLLNALLKQSRAIVTAVPGTTRDIIEETVTYRGIPIRLVDTAGLRVPSDEVEASGIERARAALKQADICLWLLDGSAPLEDADRDYIRSLGTRESIIVLNKADKALAVTEDDLRAIVPEGRTLAISAKTGEGLDALKEAIAAIATAGGALDAGLNVTARQLSELRACAEAIAEAQRVLEADMGQDVTAALLGTARKALERTLGIAADDDLLDSIFSRFCVGK